MLKNNTVLSAGYRFSLNINNIPAEPGYKLLRIKDSDSLDFKLTIEATPAQALKALLHTDIRGNGWEYLDFNESASGEFSLKLEQPAGGRAAFRFAVKNGEGLLWEPDQYHQVLVDPSSMDALCLYTMIPNVSGPIREWGNKLHEIADMGFNAVHILPFTAMCESESPYAAEDLFSIDRSLGGEIDEFRSFAAEAAGLGIRICLDIVLNHIGFENKICREHAEWIVPDRDRADGMKRAGCYHHDSWISWEDLVLLDYDHPDPAMRAELYDYMFDYVKYWVDAAGRNNVMLRLDNLHSSNKRFIKWLLPEIRSRYPGIIILSEYFGAEYHLDEAVSEYGLNLLTANSWEYPFAPVFENYISGIHKSENLRYLITPTSHDTEAAAGLFGTAESSIPRYAVCALMGTGIAGIVQGYELGVPEKINFIGRKNRQELDTSFDFSNFIARVNTLLRNEECLREKGNIEFYDTGNDSLIVCRRRSCRGGSIIIAVNLDIHKGHSFQYHLMSEAEIILSEKAESKFFRHEDLMKIKLGACGVCAMRIK